MPPLALRAPQPGARMPNQVLTIKRTELGQWIHAQLRQAGKVWEEMEGDK